MFIYYLMLMCENEHVILMHVCLNDYVSMTKMIVYV